VTAGILSLLFYYYYVAKSCDDWKQGITGELINEAPYCKVKVPQNFCWYKISDGWFFLKTKTCKMDENKKK
jgi:hypothetical protein